MHALCSGGPGMATGKITAAAMIRSNSDPSVDNDPERSNSALRAIRNVQTEMGLGGKPDEAAARAQTTIHAVARRLLAVCSPRRVEGGVDRTLDPPSPQRQPMASRYCT